MTNLSVFAFEGHQVRFVGTAEHPEWVASDVGSVLGIKNVRQLLVTFEPDEKGVCTIYTPGGSQEMLTVTEPGLYRLIFKSRKPIAKRFQRWVFHEVLPAIRKTGSYTLPQPEIERLKLELALAQTQERLMLTSQALVTLHGTGILALILGKPDAVVERVTEIEKTILVEQSGRPVKTYRGLSKTKLAKRYGFKKPQDLVNWLQSIDKLELLQPGLTAAPCQYVPYEFVPELDRLWSQRQGSRQRLLGE